ncbi:putative F-box protein pp2-b2 [Phtheirospermum japonicum]|uniref:Putative F-box protein pp2-b2 n=1 Tax=Phtheirospermum japonicum TaxID=374723 RepID=A0A830C179_9LAMI|nr:putative F-box protein pp2-b2 [Phtheirospermum japonicum]
MDNFARLPDGCISDILSFTSALDALRSSTTSKAFRYAVESDAVWERFLPRNWREILSTSVFPVKYATKKDLYFSLCDNPILIDGGKMRASDFLERLLGLHITRKIQVCVVFSEVAKLRSISWIHIQGKINTQILSKTTTYAAYLVFWLERMDGLRSSNTVVRFLNDKSENDTRNEHFEARETGKIARNRRDGWMEIEMGKFYSGSGDDGEVEAWLVEINNPHSKSGLVVEGVEFRPV